MNLWHARAATQPGQAGAPILPTPQDGRIGPAATTALDKSPQASVRGIPVN
ncbi:MAG: hypothetical protein HXY23_15125 [Parvularculaceae bacterium]|nr:hypothetical protein [Parvularculaceae bacterium]